jgi:hypothetical protein
MSWVISACREFHLKVKQIGLWTSLQLAIGGIARKLSRSMGGPHPFDVKYGTDTGGVVELGSLVLPDDCLTHAVRYQSAIVEVFSNLLAQLPIRYQEFVFVDLGSGKGRALLLASNLPFKEIIGVELSPALHQIACRNIEIYQESKQRCRLIRSICANAANTVFPDENLVIYLFNPFDEVVMKNVLRNIEDLLQRRLRPLYLCYLKPLCRKVFDQSNMLVVFRETERFVIYKASIALPKILT